MNDLVAMNQFESDGERRVRSACISSGKNKADEQRETTVEYSSASHQIRTRRFYQVGVVRESSK